MSTSKEFHDYVMEMLRNIDGVSSRSMMGEYVVYFRGKVIGLICDNVLVLKPTESVLRLLPDAERAYPYEGSKTLMAVVEDVEDTELLSEVITSMYGELPPPKPKKRSAKWM